MSGQYYTARTLVFYSLRKEIEVQERAAAADASLGDAKQTTTGSTRHRCNGLLVLLLAVGPPQLENPPRGELTNFFPMVLLLLLLLQANMVFERKKNG